MNAKQIQRILNNVYGNVYGNLTDLLQLSKHTENKKFPTRDLNSRNLSTNSSQEKFYYFTPEQTFCFEVKTQKYNIDNTYSLFLTAIKKPFSSTNI